MALDQEKLRSALDKYMHARTPEDHEIIQNAASEYMSLSLILSRFIVIPQPVKK